MGWEKDLQLEEEAPPDAAPPPGQILVEVEATGVCYRDLIDRAGRFAFIQLPVTPGHEAVGTVVGTGAGVEDWSVGDRVASMHRDYCGSCEPCSLGKTSLCVGAASVLGILVDGGYSTHLQAPERAFYGVPKALPPPHAAILHCTFGTAYRGLAGFGELGRGMRAVITGANGGVGAAAIQVASRLGAHVTAVVRDQRHRAFLTALGADHVIVDAGNNFHKQLAPAHVVMDCVGEPTFNASLRSLNVGGRLVVVGNIVPARAELNLGYIITRGIQIAGSSGATRADMTEVLALHEARPFRFDVETLPLAEADSAQRRLRQGGCQGRLVLVP